MKILYICADRGIPVRGHKGASVHVRALIQALAEAGHRVTLVTPRPGPADGPAPKAHLVHVPEPPPPDSTDGEAGRDRRSRLYAAHLTAVLEHELARQEYDFIYERYSLWSDVGARLSQATGLPLALEVNAPLIDEAARYRRLVNPQEAARVEAAQFRAASAIFVVSEVLREYVVERGAAEDRVHVLPNGVDPSRFHPAVRGGRIRRRYGLEGKLVVGFVGTPRPWHDVETLLRALIRLRAEDGRYHLLLVGKVSAELEARLEAMGLAPHVTLTGPVPHEDVPEHIAAMHVAVSPHGAVERFYFSPLKLFEYMACGVPVVAADVGQPARVVQAGVTGLLYPPGDDRALAERVRELVEDPTRARRMGWEAATLVLREFTWAHNARRIVAHMAPHLPAFRRPTATVSTPPREGAHHRGVSLPIMDPKLRQRLYRATRPDLARPLLARHVPLFQEDGPERLDAIARIRVLKYKPRRRCVLLYELQSTARADGQPVRRRVVGKVFRDGRGERLLRLQQWLWEHGFGPDAEDGIVVPEPLAYVPKMRMMVQAWAPGTTLNQMVTITDVRAPVLRAAETLAKFHAVKWPSSLFIGPRALLRPPHSAADELENVRRLLPDLCARRPALAHELHLMHDALCSWGRSLPAPEALRPVHRDFYYSQLLFHGNRVVLIDLDLAAPGDPAVDVANFVAHMHLMGLEHFGRAGALIADVGAFLETYARLCPPDEHFWQRFDFYHAATLFRLLHVVLTRPALRHTFEGLYRLAQEHVAGHRVLGRAV